MAIRTWLAALSFFALVGTSLPSVAQTTDASKADNPSAPSAQFSAQRIALIDLESVLRAASGTLRVRELLDEQRLLFQAEFAEREAALQQTERQLQADRNTLSEDEFTQRLTDFEDEVARIQREIQYRREALDLAFQWFRDGIGLTRVIGFIVIQHAFKRTALESLHVFLASFRFSNPAS